LLLNPDLTPQRQGGIFGKKFWKAQKPCRTDFVAGAALLIKRETFNQIGLLDENLYFYNDDLDWCHSARKAGWQVYIVPEAQVMHYGGYSTKKAFSRRHFVAGFTGGLYLCKKHYGTTAYWIYKILLLLLLPLAMLFSLLGWLTFREEFKDKFLAYCDVFFYALGH
jgi:GT2 family glycosyltransferase